MWFWMDGFAELQGCRHPSLTCVVSDEKSCVCLGPLWVMFLRLLLIFSLYHEFEQFMTMGLGVVFFMFPGLIVHWVPTSVAL